jgi:hypothetical protein
MEERSGTSYDSEINALQPIKFSASKRAVEFRWPRNEDSDGSLVATVADLPTVFFALGYPWSLRSASCHTTKPLAR